MNISGPYTRNLYSLSPEGTDLIIEVFRQPVRDRVAFLAYDVFCRGAYIKPIHRVVEGPLDAALGKLHSLRCGGSCTTMNVYTRESGEWSTKERCGRMPLCARLDITHYNLDTRNNEILGQVTTKSKKVDNDSQE